jgi:maltose/moltooligosaccharide transporter
MDYVVVGGVCMLIGALVTMILLNQKMKLQKKLKKKLSRYIFKKKED